MDQHFSELLCALLYQACLCCVAPSLGWYICCLQQGQVFGTAIVMIYIALQSAIKRLSRRFVADGWKH